MYLHWCDFSPNPVITVLKRYHLIILGKGPESVGQSISHIQPSWFSSHLGIQQHILVPFLLPHRRSIAHANSLILFYFIAGQNCLHEDFLQYCGLHLLWHTDGVLHTWFHLQHQTEMLHDNKRGESPTIHSLSRFLTIILSWEKHWTPIRRSVNTSETQDSFHSKLLSSVYTPDYKYGVVLLGVFPNKEF